MTVDKRSSQWNESFLYFSVKILLPIRKLETQIAIDCAEYRGRAAFTWRKTSSTTRVLLHEIITTFEDEKHPYTAVGIVREEAAVLFWAEQVQRFFQKVKIKQGPRTSENITAAAKLIARSFSDNSGLPQELVIEIDQVLPQTTKYCDWDGARETVMSHWLTDDKPDPKPDNK